MEDVPQEVIEVEEEEEEEGGEGGEAPGGEKEQGRVLDVAGGREGAHVHGVEACAATDVEHRVLSLAAVSTYQHLEGGREPSEQYCRRSHFYHRSNTHPHTGL